MGFPFFVSAQHIEPSSNWEELALQFVNPLSANDNAYILTENFFFKIPHPLDLNQASKVTLIEQLFLTPQQADAIIKHKQTYGDFSSPYELLMVDGIDRNLAYRLIPFVSAGERVASFGSTRNQLLNRLRWRSNLEESQIEGTNLYLLSKLSYQWSPNVRLGIAAENDQGEQLRWNPANEQLGTDYVSAFLEWSLPDQHTTIFFGDYEAHFGQGLAQGGGYFAGRGQDVVFGTSHPGIGLSPHQGLQESLFFRGVGISTDIEDLHLDVLASYKSFTANLNDSLETGTIYLNGLHRTTAELARRNQLQEMFYGAHLKYKVYNESYVGAGVYQSVLSNPIGNPQQHFNPNPFTGDRLSNFHVYGGTTLGSIYLFGEFAGSNPGTTAGLVGGIWSLSRQIDLAVHYRNYQDGYHAFRTGAFGQNRANTNERGIYGALSFSPTSKLKVSTYVDQYERPGISQAFPFTPARFLEIGLLADASLTRALYANIRINYEQGEIPFPEQTVQKTEREHLGISSQFQLSSFYPKLVFITRAQYKQTLQSNSPSGFAFQQEIRYTYREWKWAMGVHGFDAPNYTNRIYLPERSLSFSMDFPLLYGRGHRIYGIFQYKLSSKVRLEGKWAREIMERKLISSWTFLERDFVSVQAVIKL